LKGIASFKLYKNGRCVFDVKLITVSTSVGQRTQSDMELHYLKYQKCFIHK